MKLVRFGVAMEENLLEDLDRIVDARGSTRSEILRDLVRAEVGREKGLADADAVGALSIVYDHHVRDLTERLTSLQHELGASVRSSMHVHLSESHCLEVIVMHGHADKLRSVADQILATRGVERGGLELFADVPHDHAHEDAHAHDHAHDRAHAHAHPHAHAHAPKRRSGRSSRA